VAAGCLTADVLVVVVVAAAAVVVVVVVFDVVRRKRDEALDPVEARQWAPASVRSSGRCGAGASTPPEGPEPLVAGRNAPLSGADGGDNSQRGAWGGGLLPIK